MDNLTREQLLALVEVSVDLTHMINTPIAEQLADVLENSNVVKSPNDYYYYNNVDFNLLHKSLIFHKRKVIIVYNSDDNTCMNILSHIDNYSYEDTHALIAVYNSFMDSLCVQIRFPFIKKEYLTVVNSKFINFCKSMVDINKILNHK